MRYYWLSALLAVLLYSTFASAVELSWDILLKYFMYAMVSYCSVEKGILTWTCPWCEFVPIPSCSDVTIFESPGAGMGKIYGFIGRSNESIIVAYRGSATTYNWIEDFEFTYRDYPPVEHAFVHDGFYKGYLQVADNITSRVSELQAAYPDLTVVCTGHSLGAALALLTGAGLVQAGVKNVQVWNFGEPRVGNEVFSDYVTQAIGVIYRTINQKDVVPHLPPIDIGYHHAKTEIWFPSNYTTYVVCLQGNGEDPNCADSVPVWELTPKDHLTYLGYGWGGIQPNPGC